MKHKRLLTLLPVIFLTACGIESSNLVEGNRYTSPVFQENFYTHWDNELKNAKKGLEVDVDAIEKFSELHTIDPNVIEDLTTMKQKYVIADDYGDDYRMNKVDDSFNYGYQSKLFDGQVQCLGKYQLARVQIYNTGFSMRFSKESKGLSYFAMQFKATTDNTVDCYPIDSNVISPVGETPEEQSIHDNKLFHSSTIDLHIGVYVKEGNDIVKHTFSSVVVNENTNRGSSYLFHAFDLKEYNLSRCIGLSVTYDILEDKLVTQNKEKGINLDYCLFLYEIFLPYTTWN